MRVKETVLKWTQRFNQALNFPAVIATESFPPLQVAGALGVAIGEEIRERAELAREKELKRRKARRTK